MNSDLEQRIQVVNIRDPAPEGAHLIYIGRAMPGHSGSIFGNPLAVKGAKWTDAAEHWTAYLTRHNDPNVQRAASLALQERGYAQGDGAALYLHVLREQCRTGGPQLHLLQRLARMALRGEKLALQCWCHPKPCHGNVIKTAIISYASRMQPEVNVAALP